MHMLMNRSKGLQNDCIQKREGTQGRQREKAQPKDKIADAEGREGLLMSPTKALIT